MPPLPPEDDGILFCLRKMSKEDDVPGSTIVMYWLNALPLANILATFAAAGFGLSVN